MKKKKLFKYGTYPLQQIESRVPGEIVIDNNGTVYSITRSAELSEVIPTVFNLDPLDIAGTIKFPVLLEELTKRQFDLFIKLTQTEFINIHSNGDY